MREFRKVGSESEEFDSFGQVNVQSGDYEEPSKYTFPRSHLGGSSSEPGYEGGARYTYPRSYYEGRDINSVEYSWEVAEWPHRIPKTVELKQGDPFWEPSRGPTGSKYDEYMTKQQDTMQMISEISKQMHETAQTVIRKIG